ncbi:MAG: phosphoribosylanthranilate isomerase [Phycisphaeraceae bacterium]
MNRTRIKICGIRTPDAAEAAADAGADMVGLVFVEKSPRFVTLAEARQVIAALPGSVQTVGLFVDDSAERVAAVADKLGLSAVQLHGRESPEQAAALAPRRVLKAISFKGDVEAELARWRGHAPAPAAILLDAPPPAGSELTGGSGHSFDWRALAELREVGGWDGLPPLMLAGGLTPENVGEAIATVRPWAVDVSSGVESSRGVKDVARIRRFCDAVREADESH